MQDGRDQRGLCTCRFLQQRDRDRGLHHATASLLGANALLPAARSASSSSARHGSLAALAQRAPADVLIARRV